MNHALDTVATGLDAAQTMMDTIADNLANVNTTGFKSETPEFQSLLYQDGIQPGANSTGTTVYPSGLELGTGVKVASIKDTLTQGTARARTRATARFSSTRTASWSIPAAIR
jgi:flagellar basal-body rod protein FlgG